MPNKCLELMQKCETLPQICMDLHMSITGSGDPLSQLVFIRYVKCLELAVDNWDRSTFRTAIFDNAVLNLVICTLAEIRLRLDYNLTYKHLDWKPIESLHLFFEENTDAHLYV